MDLDFPATTTCQSIFNGGGNTEEITFPTLGSRGFTLRLFDVELKEWSIYWATSRTGALFPPVVGTFTDGRGDFYGDDTHDGIPIRTSSGPTSRPHRHGGNRSSPPTAGRPGNPIGSWSSPEHDRVTRPEPSPVTRTTSSEPSELHRQDGPFSLIPRTTHRGRAGTRAKRRQGCGRPAGDLSSIRGTRRPRLAPELAGLPAAHRR